MERKTSDNLTLKTINHQSFIIHQMKYLFEPGYFKP